MILVTKPISTEYHEAKGGEDMVKPQPEPNISIVTNVTQEQIDDDIFVSALTGVIDIRQTILLEGRSILLEKVLPFSIIGAIVDENGGHC